MNEEYNSGEKKTKMIQKKQIEKITYSKHGQAAANLDRIVKINFDSVKKIFVEAFDLFTQVIDVICCQIILMQL